MFFFFRVTFQKRHLHTLTTLSTLPLPPAGPRGAGAKDDTAAAAVAAAAAAVDKKSKAELFFEARFSALRDDGDGSDEENERLSTLGSEASDVMLSKSSRPPLQEASTNNNNNNNNKIRAMTTAKTSSSSTKIADLQRKLEQAMAVVEDGDASLDESRRETHELSESLTNAIDRADALQAAADETNATTVPNLEAEIASLKRAVKAAADEAATAASEKGAAARAAQITAAKLAAARMAAEEEAAAANAQLVQSRAANAQLHSEREAMNTSLMSQGKALDKRKREMEDVRRCVAVTEEMLADTRDELVRGSRVHSHSLSRALHTPRFIHIFLILLTPNASSVSSLNHRCQTVKKKHVRSHTPLPGESLHSISE